MSQWREQRHDFLGPQSRPAGLLRVVPKVCAGHARAYAIATLHRVEDCLGS
jgi:hypothetical protein